MTETNTLKVTEKIIDDLETRLKVELDVTMLRDEKEELISKLQDILTEYRI
jgi:hypothetical protein